MQLTYKVKKGNNKTLNELLSSELYISSNLKVKLIKNNRIKKNNKITDTREIVNDNDLIQIDFDYSEDNSNIIPTKMKLDIIYEDEWMLVINKPSGIPIHPSASHYLDSLSNGVKFYFDSINLR